MLVAYFKKFRPFLVNGPNFHWWTEGFMLLIIIQHFGLPDNPFICGLRHVNEKAEIEGNGSNDSTVKASGDIFYRPKGQKFPEKW